MVHNLERCGTRCFALKMKRKIRPGFAGVASEYIYEQEAGYPLARERGKSTEWARSGMRHIFHTRLDDRYTYKKGAREEEKKKKHANIRREIERERRPR